MFLFLFCLHQMSKQQSLWVCLVLCFFFFILFGKKNQITQLVKKDWAHSLSLSAAHMSMHEYRLLPREAYQWAGVVCPSGVGASQCRSLERSQRRRRKVNNRQWMMPLEETGPGGPGDRRTLIKPKVQGLWKESKLTKYGVLWGLELEKWTGLWQVKPTWDRIFTPRYFCKWRYQTGAFQFTSVPVRSSTHTVSHTYVFCMVCGCACVLGIWHSSIWTEKPSWSSFLAFRHISFRVQSLILNP